MEYPETHLPNALGIIYYTLSNTLMFGSIYTIYFSSEFLECSARCLGYLRVIIVICFNCVLNLSFYCITILTNHCCDGVIISLVISLSIPVRYSIGLHLFIGLEVLQLEYS